MCPEVKFWVRNLERRDFWLPLANRKFYPDFVAELTDGRRLVVEHKGKDSTVCYDGSHFMQAPEYSEAKGTRKCRIEQRPPREPRTSY
jgi:hypothetical protein